jgi:hypothetical protein
MEAIKTAFALASLAWAQGLSADKPERVVVEDGIKVEPGASYILEGRIRVSTGEAWLRVEIASAEGKSLASRETPPVREKSDWTYVAAETAAGTELQDAPARARIELWVEGKAEMNGVRLVPFSPLVLANGDMEAPLDKKGRVPLWADEKDGSLLPGKEAGSHKLDPSAPRGGKWSLAVSSGGDWHGASSINYPIPPWSDRFQITAKARSEGGAKAQILGVWSDDGGQHVLRVDQGPLVEGVEWRQAATGPMEAPLGARLLRAVLVARYPSPGPKPPPSATAWFDDVDLVTLAPTTPAARVVVNQVGYELTGPKSAVILTNFFPPDATSGTLEVADSAGQTAVKLPVECSGRMRGEKAADWGWYFWRADFTQLDKEGVYRVRARIGGAESASFPFAVGRDLLFRETVPSVVDFFFIQRCGFDVPGWHKACHLDDAKLRDGTHRDLTGGWHSAGDYNKITWEYGDGGALYALASAGASAPELLAGIDRDRDGLPDILDEALWGARYLAKLVSPGAGTFLKDIQQGPDRQGWMRWVPPEEQTDNVPGTADDPIVLEGEGHSPLAIGGWARLGTLLRARRIDNDFVALATKLWERCAEGPSAKADPLLLISTLELYAATNEERFFNFAEQCRNQICLSEPRGSGETLKGGYGDSGDIPAAALALFELSLPEGPVPTFASDRARRVLERHLERMVTEPANPFGVTRQKAGDGGYFFEPSSVYGQNFLFSCRAWSALLLYRLLGDPRALAYATDQLDFLLGKNPYNLCMFEGKGSLNPPRYHHRYDAIPGRKRGAVPGAIPNGFVRDVGSYDRPGFDLSSGGRDHPSYRTSEPWLVHDVFYLLAVTEMHRARRY